VISQAFTIVYIVTITAWTVGCAGAEAEVPQISPESILRSFEQAYPGRARAIAQPGGEPVMEIDGRTIHWAGGRMIPSEEFAEAESFTPIPFYRYPAALQPVAPLSPEEKLEIESRVANRDRNPPKRNPAVYNAIWKISNEAEAEGQIIREIFLGHSIRIHRDIAGILAKIQAELLQKAGADAELKRFLDSIESISGFYWRPIARTASLSYHSYGVALDIIAPNPEKKPTYWLWARDIVKDWYQIPLEKRLLPPESFWRVFESHGFVWGGKWFYFDTMHFEYRPEVLILNGFILHGK